MIWPNLNADEATRFEHYRTLVARLGYDLPGAVPLLLAIRGLELWHDSPHTVVSRPVYDDVFVLLWQDADGPLRVREFAGASHPYQRTSGASPDADLDGTPDVGTIRPGRYVMERLQLDPPKLWIKRSHTDARVPTDRDTNHDGSVSEAERAASRAREHGNQVDALLGDFATEVLMHPGFDSIAGSGRPYSSIGCLTAVIGDVRAVANFPRVDLLLVTAFRVLAAMERPVDAAEAERILALVANTLNEADTDRAPPPESVA